MAIPSIRPGILPSALTATGMGSERLPPAVGIARPPSAHTDARPTVTISAEGRALSAATAPAAPVSGASPSRTPTASPVPTAVGAAPALATDTPAPLASSAVAPTTRPSLSIGPRESEATAATASPAPNIQNSNGLRAAPETSAPGALAEENRPPRNILAAEPESGTRAGATPRDDTGDVQQSQAVVAAQERRGELAVKAYVRVFDA